MTETREYPDHDNNCRDEWDEADMRDPCWDCGPQCEAWGGDGLCRYEIEQQMEDDEITQAGLISSARAIRLAVVQNQYDVGNLSKEQAQELLSGPLTPGNDSSVFDDSGELREKVL